MTAPTVENGGKQEQLTLVEADEEAMDPESQEDAMALDLDGLKYWLQQVLLENAQLEDQVKASKEARVFAANICASGQVPKFLPQHQPSSSQSREPRKRKRIELPAKTLDTAANPPRDQITISDVIAPSKQPEQPAEEPVAHPAAESAAHPVKEPAAHPAKGPAAPAAELSVAEIAPEPSSARIEQGRQLPQLSHNEIPGLRPSKEEGEVSIEAGRASAEFAKPALDAPAEYGINPLTSGRNFNHPPWSTRDVPQVVQPSGHAGRFNGTFGYEKRGAETEDSKMRPFKKPYQGRGRHPQNNAGSAFRPPKQIYRGRERGRGNGNNFNNKAAGRFGNYAPFGFQNVARPPHPRLPSGPDFLPL